MISTTQHHFHSGIKLRGGSRPLSDIYFQRETQIFLNLIIRRIQYFSGQQAPGRLGGLQNIPDHLLVQFLNCFIYNKNMKYSTIAAVLIIICSFVGISFSQDYIIGEGDVLNIFVYDNEDLKTTSRVSRRGYCFTINRAGYGKRSYAS